MHHPSLEYWFILPSRLTVQEQATLCIYDLWRLAGFSLLVSQDCPSVSLYCIEDNGDLPVTLRCVKPGQLAAKSLEET